MNKYRKDKLKIKNVKNYLEIKLSKIKLTS